MGKRLPVKFINFCFQTVLLNVKKFKEKVKEKKGLTNLSGSSSNRM